MFSGLAITCSEQMIWLQAEHPLGKDTVSKDNFRWRGTHLNSVSPGIDRAINVRQQVVL